MEVVTNNKNFDWEGCNLTLDLFFADLYYAKLTPSKTFDVLKDDFDYWIISVTLFGLSAAAYIAKKFAARKSLDQAWK
jgi:hypothetical protein